MKKLTVFIIGIAIAVSASGQYMAENTYWFFFTDKNDTGYSISQAKEFLSQRSIDRRAWQSLPIDETDLPVKQAYVDSLNNLGLKVLHTSKWLNGALVQSSNTDLIDSLCKISFIDSIPWQSDPNMLFYPPNSNTNRFAEAIQNPAYSYGYAEDQITQLHLDILHESGYTGKGVLITILDAGFINMPTLNSFQRHYNENLILDTKNFVNPDINIYNNSSHGTNVSSIIFANWPDSLMGGAPDVSLLLGMTENTASETKIEEVAWIAGAEWADSIGTDIINTSLGYTLFDDSTTNYSYNDLDGNTALASRANSMTAQKGIISITSAGNEGNDEWYYIGVPADATDILAVGAVYSDGSLCNFSSRGPSYDNRIKPELVAMGGLTAVETNNGNVRRGSGTSFSAPMIAGATACLWQAFPSLPASTLMRIIINTGDQHWNANVNFGFGLPNYMAAFDQINAIPSSTQEGKLLTYPNPFNAQLFIDIPYKTSGEYIISLTDMGGRKVFESREYLPGMIAIPENLPQSIYIIKIENSAYQFRSRILKN